MHSVYITLLFCKKHLCSVPFTFNTQKIGRGLLVHRHQIQMMLIIEFKCALIYWLKCLLLFTSFYNVGCAYGQISSYYPLSGRPSFEFPLLSLYSDNKLQEAIGHVIIWASLWTIFHRFSAIFTDIFANQ